MNHAPLHPGSDAVLPCQARLQREGRGGNVWKKTVFSWESVANGRTYPPGN